MMFESNDQPYLSDSDFSASLRTSLWAVPAAALILPAFLALVWVVPWIVMNILCTGCGLVKQKWLLFLHSSTYINGPSFWVVPALSFLIALLVALNRKLSEDHIDTDHFRTYRRKAEDAPPTLSRLNTFQIILALSCALFSIGLFVNHIANTSKASAQYYDTSATIYTPSLTRIPASLDAIVKGAHSTKACALVGNDDVPNCIKLSSMPSFKPTLSTASLMAVFDNVTYPRGTAPRPSSLTLETTPIPTYSVIIDGSGAHVPLQGIEQYSNNKLSACTFTGQNRLNAAIDGTARNSFSNRVIDHNLSFTFNNPDIWGYCNRTNPVLVVPVTEQVTYRSAVISAPAGVLVVTGSPSGVPHVVYESHPHTIPGPTYPRFIASMQRTSLNWSAGRAKDDAHSFGYEPLATLTGTPNANYLEESTSNHHLYWVTPLTTDKLDRQSISAYAVVRADRVTPGHLNPFSLYVLSHSTKPLYPTPQLLVTNLSTGTSITVSLPPKSDGCGVPPKDLSRAKLTYCVNLLSKYLH